MIFFNWNHPTIRRRRSAAAVAAGLAAWEKRSMTGHDRLRPGEAVATMPEQADAEVYYLGRIRTPWQTRASCPRRGDPAGPECRIELDPRWARALTGLSEHKRLQILYWMDQARRDLVLQTRRHTALPRGTFALRSPVRPNPIASSVVDLVGIAGTTITVRGLDCVDWTPLIDIKPADRDR
jgi:tRNA-Thr(GGU) m(6)t(6)A37 methyltransferase TsaA